MARQIFNQPEKPGEATERNHPAPAPAPKLPGSVGGLRDSLREITANSIRDIDPNQIELDGLRDRLFLEDESIDALAKSIQKHGQQVPIMVRSAGKPDHYQIVYGRRRLAAILKIGGTVKAIVRTLSDDETVLAQGQENNLRLDPSFIEKALFIKEMQDAGYEPSVVQDALGLSRQGVSNHRVIIGSLPFEAIQIIGPAHGVGRRHWKELADLSDTIDLVDVAQTTVASLPRTASSAERFHAVLSNATNRLKAKRPTSENVSPKIIRDASGNTLATIASNERSVSITVPKGNNPEFCQWFDDNAETMISSFYAKWKKETRSN